MSALSAQRLFQRFAFTRAYCGSAYKRRPIYLRITERHGLVRFAHYKGELRTPSEEGSLIEFQRLSNTVRKDLKNL